MYQAMAYTATPPSVINTQQIKIIHNNINVLCSTLVVLIVVVAVVVVVHVHKNIVYSSFCIATPNSEGGRNALA